MKNLNKVKIYDNGGKTIDRFTAVYLDQIQGPKTYGARAMNSTPFHPQGFGQYCSAMLGRHLGKRIKFSDLPKDCQKLILQDLNEEN